MANCQEARCCSRGERAVTERFLISQLEASSNSTKVCYTFDFVTAMERLNIKAKDNP